MTIRSEFVNIASDGIGGGARLAITFLQQHDGEVVTSTLVEKLSQVFDHNTEAIANGIVTEYFA